MGWTSAALPLIYLMTLTYPAAPVVLPRPPATNLLPHEPPVTSSELPKQIPPPPQPAYPPSTPHYEQQLARLVWVTNTPYPVYQQWK